MYGRNASVDAARAGGWGHIIGDEGSGYWIGREALAAVMRAADGRGPATKLTEDVLAHFGIDDMSRLPRIVYDRELPRVSVAALGPIVQRASERGDAVATRILERAADELVLAARSVATKLEMRGDVFPFVLAGGVFRVVPWLADELSRRLVEVAPRCEVRPLDAGTCGRRRVARACGGAAAGARGADVQSDVTIRRLFLRLGQPRVRSPLTLPHAVAANPRLVLGLPTGRTPIPLYRELDGAVPRAPNRLLAHDHVQSRRVPRRGGARSAAATGRSCSGICSIASTCRLDASTS